MIVILLCIIYIVKLNLSRLQFSLSFYDAIVLNLKSFNFHISFILKIILFNYNSIKLTFFINYSMNFNSEVLLIVKKKIPIEFLLSHIYYFSFKEPKAQFITIKLDDNVIFNIVF
jgi:hypothetical protein